MMMMMMMMKLFVYEKIGGGSTNKKDLRFFRNKNWPKKDRTLEQLLYPVNKYPIIIIII